MIPSTALGFNYGGAGAVGATIARYSTDVSAPPAEEPVFTQKGLNLQGYLLGQPVIMYVGLILVLFLLKLYGEHPDTVPELAHVHIGGYNVITITLVAILGIDAAKILMAKWPVPGLAQVVNMA